MEHATEKHSPCKSCNTPSSLVTPCPSCCITPHQAGGQYQHHSVSSYSIQDRLSKTSAPHKLNQLTKQILHSLCSPHCVSHRWKRLKRTSDRGGRLRQWTSYRNGSRTQTARGAVPSAPTHSSCVKGRHRND